MKLMESQWTFMKSKYYVSVMQQAHGNHEVHHETCRVLPEPSYRILIGEFYNCQDAVRAARKIFLASDGCKVCSLPCHSR